MVAGNTMLARNRTKRYLKPECQVPHYALSYDLAQQYKGRVKAKRNIDTVGESNHQKTDVILDDGLPGDRDVIFEISGITSEYGITLPKKDSKKGGEEEEEEEEEQVQPEAGTEAKPTNAKALKYGISFREALNPEIIPQWAALIDEISVNQIVHHSQAWFQEELEPAFAKAKLSSCLKRPKKAESFKRSGKYFKVVVLNDPRFLKPSDIYLDGDPATFDQILNIKNAIYTVRAKFEKLWFGDGGMVNARFVAVRLNVHSPIDESDEGFLTEAVNIPKRSEISSSDASSGSAPVPPSTSAASTVFSAGAKRSATTAHLDAPSQSLDTPFQTTMMQTGGDVDKDTSFMSSPKRVCLARTDDSNIQSC